MTTMNPVLRFAIQQDNTRDNLLTDFGKQTLRDRYLLPGETFQGLFARVACAYADTQEHAQRLYDAISRLWFMPSTPVLSNGGTTRGLPISCHLNEVEDSMEGIADIWNDNVWLASLGGGIGCVDSETEYLSRTGWKKISEYTDGEEIMVVSEDGETASFEQPLEYISGKAGLMYRLYGTYSEAVVSHNHRHFVRFDGRSKFGVKTTDYLLEGNSLRHARFKPHVVPVSGKGLPYTNPELRFLVALAADGSNVHGREGDVKFTLRRHRKIERLRNLLDELGIYYVEGEYDWGVNFHLPDCGITKMPLDFENFGEATPDQLRVIFDELGFWDGSFDKRNTHLRFSSMKKSEADFVQYVMFSVTGCRAGMGVKTRDGEWAVRETADTHTMFSRYEVFEPEDGKQYCFRTSTSFWLCRRGSTVLVTGNSHWGNVRSVGEKVGLVGETSGIMPFLKVMDSQTLAVAQGNLRRGSAAVYLPIDHPEIEEFIEMRRPTGGDPNRKCLNLFNAVTIPNAFMEAVIADKPWELRSPKTGKVMNTVSARSLWIRLLTARLETGAPYITFIDTVNDMIPPHHKELNLKVKTSNLCNEITLPTGRDHLDNVRSAVCCLSSLNLDTYNEWKNDPNLVEDVLRFLDNVLQDFIDRAPKDKMSKSIYSAMRERSVGLGVMGFHSFLQSMNVPFESVVAKSWNRTIFTKIKNDADAANIKLADEKGACPDAAEVGYKRRFSNMFAIAPTASISIICGGASPGIEPSVANVYSHKTLGGTFTVRNLHLKALLAKHGRDTPETWTDIMVNKGSVQHLDFLDTHEKDVFKTAIELDQRWVIEHAADRTPMICQSQSLNIFLPADVSKKELNEIHMLSWKKRLKGLYYCRSLSIQRAETVSQKVPAKAHTNAQEVSFEGDVSCSACQ